MDQIPEDIERMAKFLGWEDPAIRRLLKAYIRDPEMREAISNILKRRCVQAGFDPNPSSPVVSVFDFFEKKYT